MKASNPSYRELTRDSYARRLARQGLREEVLQSLLDQYADALFAPDGLIVVSTPNRRSLPGARRWLAERVPGIRLSLAPVDTWQTWTDLESHGAAAGQNGFKLSLRGYDNEGDFLALTHGALGRRVVGGRLGLGAKTLLCLPRFTLPL